MDNNNSTSILSTAMKGIALILGLFILGNVIGSLSNIKRTNTLETVYNQTDATESTTDPQIITTTQPTTETPTQITTTESTTIITTTAVTTTEDTTPDTNEEIVALFNKSANNVKKNASKVIRNYENIRHEETLSDYPIVLKLAYGSLIDSWLVNHDTPVEYAQTDLIRDNFPVKGKDWSSTLSANDVDNVVITEKDGNYHITINLAYCKNPAENTGVCSVMQEVDLEKVQELVDIVKSCETEYYDCKIECIIEKDTGNMIYAKYTQPMVLNITTQRLTQLEAVFAMSIENEFEIEY